MKAPLTLLYFMVCICACNFADGNYGINPDDPIKLSNTRYYSPDSSKIISFYTPCQGAWDGCNTTWALVIDNTDTVLRGKNIITSIVEYDYDKIYWSGDTVVVHQNYMETIRNSTVEVSDTVMMIEELALKFVVVDPIDSTYTRNIIYQSTSPDNKKEVIAYRYELPQNGYYPIHVSVIDKGEPIPKYGNFLMGRYEFNCVENIAWSQDNKLLLDVSSACIYAMDGYLVPERPNQPYIVRESDYSTRGNLPLF